MKKILFLCVLCLAAAPTFAQKRAEGRAGIESAKIGFLTTRLNLTTEQAMRFWPVYKEFTEQRQTLRRSMRQLRIETGASTASDEQLLADLKELMALKQKEVDLERDAMNRLLKVINPHQLAELYKAERDFTKEVLSTLRDRRK